MILTCTVTTGAIRYQEGRGRVFLDVDVTFSETSVGPDIQQVAKQPE